MPQKRTIMRSQGKTALDKLLSQTNMDIGFQGDEAGANSPESLSPKQQVPVPGTQGEGEDARVTDGIEGEPETSSTTEATPIPQAVEVDNTPPENLMVRGPGFVTVLGYLTLRIAFILSAIAAVLLLGLYTLKLCGIYDLCEAFAISSQKCITTPYMNGFLNHVKCSEERQCLPGFWSMAQTEEWSLKKD